jgi:hypothetical protein
MCDTAARRAELRIGARGRENLVTPPATARNEQTGPVVSERLRFRHVTDFTRGRNPLQEQSWPRSSAPARTIAGGPELAGHQVENVDVIGRCKRAVE